MPWQFELVDRQPTDWNRSLLTQRLESLEHGGLKSSESRRVVVTLVDDAEIRRINAQFLQHDWATDVISFPLEDDAATLGVDGDLLGELVVSMETARREAERVGWSLDDELLLYCVHGLLHLLGYDDLDEESRRTMRQKEREVLARFQLCPKDLQD